MARSKSATPRKGEITEMSSLLHEKEGRDVQTNGHAKSVSTAHSSSQAKSNGLFALAVCVGGIYASFLSWAILQERITTTTYGLAQNRWTYSIVLNTIQSAFAACTGLLYLWWSGSKSGASTAVIPSRRMLGPLLLVAVSSSLASPFGYASLAHIDYLTFLLAKSCKLLPVMFLHVTIFRRKYATYKYAVVMAVTIGVAVFTLSHSGSGKKKMLKATSGNTFLGLTLLAVNLLLDGITNTVQDQIFTQFKPYSGPQMMVAQNLLATLLTSTYLLVLPLVPPSIIQALPFAIPDSARTELPAALTFLSVHPQVWTDVLGFAACGAIGQVFIYATLERFESLVLVTVTVTRKMISMLLSVVWFGKSLSPGQWAGVGLVFGGVGVEGFIGQQEKKKKKAAERQNGHTKKES